MKSYLITDPRYYHDLDSFSDYLYKIYHNHHVDFASFRDKETDEIAPYAKLFLEISKKFVKEKVLLHHDLFLADRLGFDGVHLSSSQFTLISEAKLLGLYTFVSTHTLEEIQQVALLGGDAVTISPIFTTPNKGEPKGISFLKKAALRATKVKLFALGGIVSQEQVALCQKSGADGFASIRYFI